MTSKRDHWSYSSINQYLRCPLQYYFERVLKLPRKSIPSAMVMGSAIHAGLAEFHRTLQHGDEPSNDHIREIVVGSWKNSCNENVVDFKDGNTQEELIKQSIELVELYTGSERPTNIRAVELPFWVPIITSSGEVLEKPLLAVADLIVERESGLTVREFKSSGRSYSDFEVSSSLQATCYVHATWEKLSQWSQVEFTVLVKTKTPKIQNIPTTRTSAEVGRMGDLFQQVASSIELGIFYPIENVMNCSGCPYRAECKHWVGSKPNASTNPIRKPINGVHACLPN
jgi:putative RecB family exonuclease